ncbi:hypothetical protein QO002_000074 [Pararhizobium capsulatum DSM 1112]|uniref:Uncharacterized protein n=1 Tax=Pararhizobium capsulatum DSM 1112 TaxID=1121113 RepID=A0ABU0BI52_9HYPH|nr:hypothetical protein [Pararhizobium capsulatum]MDQ0317936.1 hypothetical protein [Pararhizobium capsulatum DSM 1112]
MRPTSLLSATKVLATVIVLIFGMVDLAAARDIGERTIYRRGHYDRLSHSRPDHSRPEFLSRNRHRYDDRHDRHSDRRFAHRRDRQWRADNRRDRRYDRPREFVREYSGPRGRGNVTIYGGDGFPSPIPGIGTYAGGLSAWRDPGNGIYFSNENYGSYGYGDVSIDVDLGAYMGGPQILDVDPAAVDNACSYEKGVCVIRRR